MIGVELGSGFMCVVPVGVVRGLFNWKGLSFGLLFCFLFGARNYGF